MDNKYLNQIQLESLEKYYKYLSQFGYMKMTNVNILFVSVFLIEVLNNYGQYVTEEDYQLIDTLLRQYDCCSCLVSYDRYKNAPIESSSSKSDQPIKVTENTNIRTTQTDNLRLPNLL